MSLTYTIKNQEGFYYITITAHQWDEIFTRRDCIDIFLESIKYCQNEKGLKVYVGVIPL